MRFATSSFKTLVRSDWQHYWPIAFVYTAIWVVGLPVSIWRTCMEMGKSAECQYEIASTTFVMQFMGLIMAAVFGVILAMAVYSYLMTARSVGLHHSLPITRTTQFFAHAVSAMEMLLAGNLITFALTLLVEAVQGMVLLKALLWWLLVVTLLDVTFLALGIFCAMLTGWVLAVPVIYMGINFIAAVADLLLQGMASIFYFGYSSDDLPSVVCWLTPTLKLGSVLKQNHWTDVSYPSGGISMETLKVVLLYAAVGVVLLLVAFWLYRTRSSESAAEPVAVSRAKPIFRYVIALVGGMALGLGLYELLLYGSDSLVLLVVCVVLMASLCYIAAEMILRKSFRVFRRSWKGLVGLCITLVLVSAGLKLDVFGYQNYLPEAEQVKKVTFHVGVGTCSYDVSGCTDRETIEALLAVHTAVLEQGMQTENDLPGDETYGSVNMTYTMQSGEKVSRWYDITVERGDTLYIALNTLTNMQVVRRQALLGDGLSIDSIYGGYISSNESEFPEGKTLTKEAAQQLYAALLRDAELGHGQRDILDESQSFTLQMEFYSAESDVWLSYVTPDCAQTVAVLLELGIADQAEDLFCHAEGA